MAFMTRFRQHFGNHRRTLLLLAAGAVMFLLWLGLWLRVLPDRPRVSIAQVLEEANYSAH